MLPTRVWPGKSAEGIAAGVDSGGDADGSQSVVGAGPELARPDRSSGVVVLLDKARPRRQSELCPGRDPLVSPPV